MVLVFHHVIIFFLLSDWLIQILPPFWFCCDVACFCFGSETQLKCTYRRCCQFFKNIVLCLDVLSGGESASMATFFFLALLLFSSILTLSCQNLSRNENVSNLFKQRLTHHLIENAEAILFLYFSLNHRIVKCDRRF